MSETSNDRPIDEQKRVGSDIRRPAQIDRDRLLYSTCFARLAEVTQVISADHGYVFHNRLTHSLKVAQLSRRIAENLKVWQSDLVEAAGGIDEDAAEAAGLAHDLGHPPFGHIAEEELNDVIKEIAKKEGVAEEGFEGNAQSFRLVTRLAVGDAVSKNGHSAIVQGLNLTRRTLNGILKYPWIVGNNNSKPHKWGAYRSEQDYFDFARGGSKSILKSLEAEVMDWADDITYAVHDVVDFYTAGKIPLERFAEQNEVELSLFFEEVFSRKGNEKLKLRQEDYKAAFRRVCREAYSQSIQSRYKGSSKERSNLWLMMTYLITRYCQGLRVAPSAHADRSLVCIDRDCEDEIAMLKQLTWHYVILHNDLALVQHGQRFMVRSVFEVLFDASKRPGGMKLFPSLYEELLKSVVGPAERIRLVSDYVSGMTEAEISTVFKKLQGHKVGPILGA